MSDQTMIRKHFRVTKRQDLLIKHLAKKLEISEAEFIRRAIERETAAEPAATTFQSQTVPDTRGG